MSGLMEDLRTYSPEDQTSIAHVEMLLMQRRIKYYPSTLSKLVTTPEPLPVVHPPVPVVASNSFPQENHP
jgi:hypothetical protein